MAHVERPTYTQPVPPGADVRTSGGQRYACWTDRTGKAVRALVLPSGKCRRVVPNRWVGVYRDHRGVKCKTPTFGDRAAALRAALDAERQAEAVQEGRASPGRPAGKCHLLDHVGEFLAELAARGDAAKHVAQARGVLEWALPGAGLTTAAAVDAERVRAWLELERRAGDPRRKDAGPLTVRTRNMWVTVLKGFGRWLARTGRAAANPFDALTRGNELLDRKRVRRPLPVEQLAALVAAADRSDTWVEGMGGPDRATLYLLAAYTGLRAGALARLTPESFVWAGGEPVKVFSPPRAQKSRRPHGVDLHPSLRGRLAAWLADRPAGRPVFTGNVDWWASGAKMVRHDLAAAGVPYAAADGTVFDFHALRLECGYLLASHGVPLVAAQQILDHSTPALTANIYSKFGGELAGEVAKMPSLGTLGAPLGSEVGGPRRKGPPPPAKKSGRKTKKPAES